MATDAHLAAVRHLAPEVAGHLRPRTIHATTGAVENADALLTGTRDFDAPADRTCTMTTTGDTHASIVLDYGVVVCGVPVFFVQSVAPPAGGATAMVLQATYAEVYAYIDRPDGDGPFPFTAGADTLRINKHTVEQPGTIEHFQLQGGQRWQRLELLTAGTVRLTLVGFKPVTFNAEPADMAGFFACSDQQLNDIWETGARTVQINSLPAKASVPNWQVLPSGTYIASQRASHYVWGGNWTDYAVQVEANILEGGFALAIRSRNGFGPLFQFYLDGGGGTLRIDLLYGFYNEAQITLWPTPCDTWQGAVTAAAAAGGWHTWEVTAYGNDEYTVLLDGTLLTTFAQKQGTKNNTNGKPTDVQPHEGSFGFGTGRDQTAMFRNVRVVSSAGRLLYASSMKDPHVLTDFAVGTNQLPCMLDGAKRDRAVWLGDTIVPALALYYSTGAVDFVLGSIEAILSRQRDDGTVPAYGLVGFPGLEQHPEREVSTAYHSLAGTFTMYVVRICHDYLLYTGNIAYTRAIYPKLQKLMALLTQRVDARGLVTLEGPWAMDSDYYNKPRSGSTTKNNAVYAIALRRLALVADALDDKAAAATYRAQADAVRAAVNRVLFSAATGLYEASENDRGIVSEDANAFAILAGFPTSDAQRARVLRGLYTLATPGGWLSFNRDSGYMDTPVVSPIMNGWHAEAALQSGGVDGARDAVAIWRACWGPMVDRGSPYYSGAHWEFSTPEGAPHMAHFCSMAHPFSSLPVYSLSVHALGLATLTPGWATFVLRPHVGFLNMLDFARGRVPVPHDGTIHASWTKEAGSAWSATLSVPTGCSGLVVWPRDSEKRAPRYNGVEHADGLAVAGGTSVHVQITYI